MKMEQTQCYETSAIKHHTPGNHPKDYMQHSYKFSLKSIQWEPVCFMGTDRWADMKKLIIAFCSFENAPKK
jgi:hypothetical protein